MKYLNLFKVFGSERKRRQGRGVGGYLLHHGKPGNPGKSAGRPKYIRLGNHIFTEKLTREIIDRLRGDYNTIIYYFEGDNETEEYALEKGLIPIKIKNDKMEVMA